MPPTAYAIPARLLFDQRVGAGAKLVYAYLLAHSAGEWGDAPDGEIAVALHLTAQTVAAHLRALAKAGYLRHRLSWALSEPDGAAS